MSNNPPTFDEKLRQLIISEFSGAQDAHITLDVILSSLSFQAVQAVTKFLPTRKMRRDRLKAFTEYAFEQWDKQNAPKLTIVEPTPPNQNEQN